MTAAAADSTRPDASAAFQALDDASQLARRCEGYWQDHQDQQPQPDGQPRWTVHCAVDVDVIALYSQPGEMTGYARIFSGLDAENPQARALLAELLGHHVMQRLPGLDVGGRGKGPLLLIPPHDDEFDRMCLAVARQALQAAHDGAAELPAVVEVLAREMRSTPDDVGAAVQLVVKHFSQLVAAFDGESGPVRKLRRLATLKGRLLVLDHAAPYRRDVVAERLLPRIDGRDAPDRQDYFARVRAWRERLQRHQPRNKPAYALQRDAMALATLEMVNERAGPLRQRLVLITGSPYLFEAAAELRVAVEGRLPQTFADAYLRHPQAFIGAKSFFERDDVAEPADGSDCAGIAVEAPAPAFSAGLHRARLRIVDWLNLCVPDVLRQARPVGVPGADRAARSHDATVRIDHAKFDAIRKRSERWVNETLGTLAREKYKGLTGREFPDGMLEDFARQITELAADIGLAVEAQPGVTRAQRFVEELNARLNSGFTVEQLQEELTSRIEETVIQLYLETGGLGAVQLIAQGETVRGVPALRFDSGYRRAQERSEALCRTLWMAHDDASRFDLAEAYAALDGENDKDHYHAHLIHAQVYAARGHWFAARTLSRMALRVADLIPEGEQHGRRGREAAYLMAVAERRLAQKSADLQRVRDALAEVRRRETPGTSRVDPRFRAEDMAVRVAELQFQRFQAEPVLIEWPLTALLAEAAGILGDLRPGWDAALDPDSDPDSVCCWVRRQVTTNLLVVALLARSDGRNSPDVGQVQALRELMDAFRTAALAPDSLPDSKLQVVFSDGLSSFVYNVAVVVFTDDVQRQRDARRRLAVVEKQSLGPGAPPFEVTRKQLLLRLAGFQGGD